MRARSAAWVVLVSVAGCEGVVSEPLMEAPRDLDVAAVTPVQVVPDACHGYPSPPAVYGAKVKTLLTGLPLTADELGDLRRDPAALEGLVEQWFETPEASTKLLEFFASAFQQGPFQEENVGAQIRRSNLNLGIVRGTGNQRVRERLLQNVRESFARTVLALVREGRPFSEFATTRRFQMTPALMVFYAFADEVRIDDNSRVSLRSGDTIAPSLTWQSQNQFSDEEVLDPASPRFMQFFADANNMYPECAGGRVTATPGSRSWRAFEAMFGYFNALGPEECRTNTRRDEALLDDADFDSWRWVEIRQPAEGEPSDPFIDLVRFREASELVLHTPRVGFMTTPAFFAVWPTNEDNQARVTMNQTLITALGESIDDSQTIIPAFDDALDGAHADPTTTCWGCHRTLDPMRQFFRRSYTYRYSEQEDEEVLETRAAFAWDGIEATGETIFDLARVLGEHPSLPRAWAQKLCFDANSAPCPEGEELDQVVDAFTASNLDFRVLVRELFASPLVTGDRCVQGSAAGEASLARARHFCTTLSHRSGIENVCGLEVAQPPYLSDLSRANRALSATIPDDGFSRGDADPLTLRDPNLFIRASYERICSNVADAMIDAEDALLDSGNPEASIDWIVTHLLGHSVEDPRRLAALAILTDHFADAVAEEEVDAPAALRSTFTLACVSPPVIGAGL